MAFGVHAVENGNAHVDVVVEFDVVFAGVAAQQPPDVLHDPPFEREWEGEEQGVELGPVESFAEVGAGGDEHDPGVGVAFDRWRRLTARRALTPSPPRSTRAWSPSAASVVTMVSMCSVRWVSTRQVRPAVTAVVHVGADLGGALLVVDERAEHVLDVGGVVVVDLGRRVVHDQLASDECGAFDGSGFDLVAGGAALKSDQRFKPVSTVGGGGQAEPAACASARTQAWNETAGMWWHSSTTTTP